MNKKYVALIVFGVLAIIGLIFSSSFFEVISAGHRGVGHTFGDVSEDVYAEGLHFKAPWRTIVEIDVRQLVETTECASSSKDLQSVTTTVAVTYNADPERVWWVYQNLGDDSAAWVQKKMDPIISETVKAVTAQYTAADLIQQRQLVKDAIQHHIHERAASEASIMVTSVNITNFSFSDSFDDSIEAKVRAEQDALRAKNELDKERTEQEKRIVQAEAEKTEQILKAEGLSQSILLEAMAQAEANRALSASIDDKVLAFKKLDKWDGKLPKVTGGNAAVLIDPDKD